MSTDPYNFLLDEMERAVAPKPKTARPSNRYGAYEAQTEGDWSISRAPQVKDWYKQTYGRDLPVTAEGQSRRHSSMGLNHSDSLDVGLNPTTPEGQAFASYLKQNRIPYLAYDRAVPGAATGAHFHVGHPSKRGSAQPADPYAALLDQLESSPATPLSETTPESPAAGAALPAASLAPLAPAGARPPQPDSLAGMDVQPGEEVVGDIRRPSLSVQTQEGRRLRDEKIAAEAGRGGLYRIPVVSGTPEESTQSALHFLAKEVGAPVQFVEQFLKGKGSVGLSSEEAQTAAQTGHVAVPAETVGELRRAYEASLSLPARAARLVQDGSLAPAEKLLAGAGLAQEAHSALGLDAAQRGLEAASVLGRNTSPQELGRYLNDPTGHAGAVLQGVGEALEGRPVNPEADNQLALQARAAFGPEHPYLGAAADFAVRNIVDPVNAAPLAGVGRVRLGRGMVEPRPLGLVDEGADLSPLMRPRVVSRAESPPVETATPEVVPAPETQPQAAQASNGPVTEVARPLRQRFQHRDFGLVEVADNQAGVPQGKVRVVSTSDGAEHIIQKVNGRGDGNRIAVPVKEKVEGATHNLDFKGAMSNLGLDAAYGRDAWERLGKGKKVLFSERPGSLENYVQREFDAGRVKSADDITAIYNRWGAKRAEVVDAGTSTSGEQRLKDMAGTATGQLPRTQRPNPVEATPAPVGTVTEARPNLAPVAPEVDTPPLPRVATPPDRLNAPALPEKAPAGKTFEVKWADGRAVQYFDNLDAAKKFRDDKFRLDDEPGEPRLIDTPKGARVKSDYFSEATPATPDRLSAAVPGPRAFRAQMKRAFNLKDDAQADIVLDLTEARARAWATEAPGRDPSDYYVERFAGVVRGGESAPGALNQVAQGATQTPEFRNWFGASKVVNGSGEPLIVYHGTNADFNVYDTARTKDIGVHFGTAAQADMALRPTGKYAEGANIQPVYLKIENPLRVKDEFSTLGRRFIARAKMLALETPGLRFEAAERARLFDVAKEADAVRRKAGGDWAMGLDPKRQALAERHEALSKEFWDIVQRAAERSGHDGLVYKNRVEGKGDSYVALRPEQIKSVTGNRGTFDPSDPNILRQENKAAVEFLSDNRAILRAFQKADVSSAVHELGHVFRRDLPENLLRDAEEAIGVKAGKWTTPDEEKFARGFERYLKTGEAPDTRLRRAFESFKTWLTEIYGAVRGKAHPLNFKPNEKLTAVFDRMLGGEPKGEYGQLIHQLHKAPNEGTPAFFENAQVKRSLGLKADASTADVRAALTEAVGKPRSSHLSPEDVRTWADTKNLQGAAREALDFATGKYAETVKAPTAYEQTGIRKSRYDPATASISEAVRALGGFRITPDNRGELKRLQFSTGLARRNGGVGVDEMITHLKEDGYFGWDEEVTPSDLLEMVESDARGMRRHYSHSREVDYEAQYRQENPQDSTEALEAFILTERGGILFDKVDEGSATRAEVAEFRRLAGEAGVHPEHARAVVARGEKAKAAGVSDSTGGKPEDDFDFRDDPVDDADKPSWLYQSANKPQQLGFVSEGLVQESARPSTVRPKVETTTPAKRALGSEEYARLSALKDSPVARLASEVERRVTPTNAQNVPDVVVALSKLADLKRQKQTVDDYLNQGSLFGDRELTPAQERILSALDRNPRKVLDEAFPAEAKPQQDVLFQSGEGERRARLSNRAAAEVVSPQARASGTEGRGPSGARDIRRAVPVPSKQGDAAARLAVSTDTAGARVAARGDVGRAARGTVTETPEFKRWFGGSKVVDESGEPRVLYHGTNADFSEFSRATRGRNTGSESARKAFFFVDDPSVASGYTVRPLESKAFTEAQRASLDAQKAASERAAKVENWKWGDPVAEDVVAAQDEARAASDKLGRILSEDALDNEGANVMPVYASLRNPLIYDAKGESAAGLMNRLVDKARAEGRDGVIVKNVVDTATQKKTPATVYAVFKPEQIKSATGNRGTFDPSDPNILYQADTSAASRRQRAYRALLEAKGQGSLSPELRGRPKLTTKEKLADIANAPRSLKSSVDLSAAMRQGAMFTLTHPFRATQIFFGKQLKSLSNKGYENFVKDLKADPDLKQMRDAGLHLTSLADEKIGNREEAFASKFVGKLPIVGGRIGLVTRSEHAYVTFLDAARSQWFKQLKSQAEDAARKSGKPVTKEQYETIAKFVNRATGRGDLGRGAVNDAAPLLNSIFFAPRYAVSKVQVFDPRMYVQLPPGARRMAMRQAAQYFATIGATAMLLKYGMGVEVGTDPEESDFMKVRVGNTRYDLAAGSGQYVTLAARLLREADKSRRGENTEAGRILDRFTRYKYAPLPAAVRNTWEGKDAIGKKTSVGREALSLVTPIYLTDLYEAFQQEGMAGVAKNAPGFVGVGVQTYQDRPLQRPNTGRTVRPPQMRAPRASQ